MDIKICKITPRFAKEISDLGLVTKEFQYNSEQNTTYSENDIKRAIKSRGAICLMAVVNGDLAGFIIRTYHPFFKEDYLNELYVKEKYRNKGIAQTLIDKSLKIVKSKGASWSWTLVQDNNKIMQKFLEKNGFKKGKKFYFYHKDNI